MLIKKDIDQETWVIGFHKDLIKKDIAHMDLLQPAVAEHRRTQTER